MRWWHGSWVRACDEALSRFLMAANPGFRLWRLDSLANPFAVASLRGRFTRGIVVIVAALLLIGGGAQAWINYVQAVALATQVQRAEAATAAYRIEAFLDTVVAPLQSLARMPWGVGDLTAEYRAAEFRKLMNTVPSISRLNWNDHRDESRIHLSRTDPDRVQALRETQARVSAREDLRPAFGEPYAQDGLDYYVDIAIRDTRTDGGTTVATINLRFVSELTERLRVGRTGIAYVLDGKGRIIAHPRISMAMKLNPDRTETAKADMASDASTRMVAGLGGRKDAMSSSATIPLTGWRFVVQQETGEVLQPVFVVLLQTALLLAAALLIGLYLGRRVAAGIVTPIENLDREARRFAAGDLSSRILVTGEDEVSKLAHSFNHMAGQLQEYTGQLEQKVVEKTAQLELANRHKSEFLANMSHELRTPLNAIIGFSDVLKAELFGSLNAKQKEYAADISASGQHLLALINDILDLSKVEAGRMDVEMREFSLKATLDNAMQIVRGQAMSAGIRLDATVEDGVDEVVADERKIKQVLINLLANAVKFSHQGGWVRVGVGSGDNEIIVRVTDSGPGIEKENQAVIFEAFRQLPTVAGHKHEGTGLGLALVKRLIELHGGRVWVESEPGNGATFAFTIPDRKAVTA